MEYSFEYQVNIVRLFMQLIFVQNWGPTDL